MRYVGLGLQCLNFGTIQPVTPASIHGASSVWNILAQLTTSFLSNCHSNDNYLSETLTITLFKFSIPAPPSLPIPICLFNFSPLLALITNCYGSFYGST